MPRMLLVVLIALLAVRAGAQTTNNDDSCDISVAPAATLLLPYFEVDLTGPGRKTTLFTVTNVSPSPQIVRMTVWTDLSFPLLTLNLVLTAYDVEAINLHDLLGRGRIHRDAPRSTIATCESLSTTIPPPVLADVQTALTRGTYSTCGTARIGTQHRPENVAIGYVTMDVVAVCAPTLPAELRYFTHEILFDNVLIGDYVHIDPNRQTGNLAGGGPLVHLRAVPEGGLPGSSALTNLPFTFYDRYTQGIDRIVSTYNRTHDRRQPLPSRFAARYMQGGTNWFNTNIRIWRETPTSNVESGTTCGSYFPRSGNLGNESAVAEIIRFDEHENVTTTMPPNIGPPIPIDYGMVRLPASSSQAMSATGFPPMPAAAGDIGGWMYLNLSNGGTTNGAFSVTEGGVSRTTTGTVRNFDSAVLGRAGYHSRPSQAWATISIFWEGRFAVELDAAALGNGCSAPGPYMTSAQNPIAPSENRTP